MHYCLGSSVAKTQLRAPFNVPLTRVPDIEIGEPEWPPNQFAQAIKRLPARIR
jgi:cytochrome P450